ncbi:MAG: response regulator [Thiomargarita sp.]|nr:response regulator [Thiomargarita sp.]
MERKYKLLIVDDDNHIRTTFQDYFTKRSFIVETASDGIEGLEKLRADEFDVAIVDMKMPKMNGIDMINQALKNDEVDANMIIISTPHESNKGDVIKALNIGVDAWFEKSVLEMPQLLKRVTELAQVIPPEMVRRVTSMIPN